MKVKLTREEKKALKNKAKQEGKGIIVEFKKFITRGNIVDMAVGVIIGTAFTKIVTSLTQGIIMPFINWLVSLIAGELDLADIYTILGKTYYEDEACTIIDTTKILANENNIATNFVFDFNQYIKIF